MRQVIRKTAYLALGLLLAGCATHADGTQSADKAAIGAAIGAVNGPGNGDVTGPLAGQRIDHGSPVERTVIGAMAGATPGGGIGYLMDRQEAELRERLAGERSRHQIEIERVREDLLKVTLANEISFDFNSAVVKPAFQPTLAKLAEVLVKYQDHHVTVVGHTDSTGSNVYNEGLSRQRAAAVVGELIRLGVPSSRMSAVGQGEGLPRASNATEAGQELNRRVEILLQPAMV